jgi:tryptophan-rich sensory protein
MATSVDSLADRLRDTRAQLRAHRRAHQRFDPALAGFVSAVVAAALLGSAFTPSARNRSIQRWYGRLDKARLQPPPEVFGPVWTALCIAIALSGYRVYRAPMTRARRQALILWWAQMIMNAAWSPLFFGARRTRISLADLAGTGIATIAFANSARAVDRTAARLTIPYIMWLMFAGYLNAEIVRKNR